MTLPHHAHPADQDPQPPTSASAEQIDRFDRLRRSHVFREGRLDQFQRSRLVVAGAGHLGGLLVPEIIRSGAAADVFDPDTGSVTNLGTQRVEVGVPKVETLVRHCNAVIPGRARGLPYDIRHADQRLLRSCQAIVDCTDDPQLVWDLNALSLGWGVPLLRMAVDGSGEQQLGRVLCSAGQAARACAVCALSLTDLTRLRSRTPCLGQAPGGHPPTVATTAIGLAVVGLALSQLQRLLTGVDLELVLDREVWISLDTPQIFTVQRPRSAQCLGDHRSWELVDVSARATELTVGDLLGLVRQFIGTDRFALSGYLHPLNTLASCPCGLVRVAVGTSWAEPARCDSCGQACRWLAESQQAALTQQSAGGLGVLDRTVASLGYPPRGGLFVIQDAAGERLWRVLLD